MFELILIIYFAIFFLLYLMIVLLFYETSVVNKGEPKICILIPVRNEGKYLERTLKSLISQNYSNYKIIVGNDNSTDNTEDILKKFSFEYPEKVSYINIKDNRRAKQGVIERLVRLVDKDTKYFIITDGDIVHKSSYLRTIVSLVEQEGADMLSHPTIVFSSNLFSALQNIDWEQGIATAIAFDRLKVPTTAIGNNMIVKLSTYMEVGGYEVLPLSLTEDYLLYNHFLSNGKKAIWRYNKLALAYTYPEFSWKELVKQRLRWFQGAKNSNTILKLFTSIIYFFPIMLVLSLFVNFWYFLLVLFIYLVLGLILEYKYSNLSIYSISLVLHPLYIMLLNLLIMIEIVKGAKVIWKDRSY